MDYEVLLERVKRWGGLKRRREAERATVATLRALRELLFDDEADALARELPSRLARVVRKGSHAAPIGLAEFYQHAARFEGGDAPFANEHAQAVCQALASVLPPASVARLARALPELAPLFVVPDRDSHPATIHSTRASTIAEGHVGSDHPLSEARRP